jgi:peptidoglycan hydrolase-like protein with peptidoglycan-binding domain
VLVRTQAETLALIRAPPLPAAAIVLHDAKEIIAFSTPPRPVNRLTNGCTSIASTAYQGGALAPPSLSDPRVGMSATNGTEHLVSLLKSVAVGLTACASLAVGAVGLAAPASAQSSWVCGYTNSQPTLARGATGIAVKQAQCEINAAMRNNKPNHLPLLAVDGIFGYGTDLQVTQFQSMTYLSADDPIGAYTWSTLNYYALNCVVGGFPNG